MSGVTNYPHASINELRQQYVGRLLEEVDNGPIAVVDKAITRRNCELMLDACEHLGVPFRSHVKTHKVIAPFFPSFSFFFLLKNCHSIL